MKKTDTAAIGERIRTQRQKLGYSREKLAEIADISNSFLSDIEHGTKNFTVPNLASLCRALGVSADYLVFGTTEENSIGSICQMLSGMDSRYLPLLEELLAAYIKTISIAETR